MSKIIVPFAGDMPEGAQIQAFVITPAAFTTDPGFPFLPGMRLGPLETELVSGSQVTFTKLLFSDADILAFCGFSGGMLIWQAGGDLNTVETGFWIIKPSDLAALSSAPLTITPTQLTSLLPSLPLSEGPATITSLTAAPGINEVVVSGTISVSSIPANFQYVFSLNPLSAARAA